jgi:small subunit ribosomal protein S1
MENRRRTSDSPMPAIDEGWWEAVLAEERSQGHQRGAKPTRRPAQPEDSKFEQRPHPNWGKVKLLFDNDEIVDLRVTGCNRGGLLVEGDELSGFVPFSHLVGAPGASQATERSPMLEGYVGRTLRLKVIECVPEDGRVVFSERAAQAEPGRRAQIFHALKVGECVRGTVTNITDFGVFVDLGGVEGLVHISELSWGRVLHPGNMVTLGQSLEVQVLDLSQERCRVALSLKRLLPNPWTNLGAELGPGAAVPAVITSVLSYGAFAKLERGVEGLIHVSEMPLGDGQVVRDLLHEGQTVQVRVLHVDAAHQRMGLTMKTPL